MRNADQVLREALIVLLEQESRRLRGLPEGCEGCAFAQVHRDWVARMRALAEAAGEEVAEPPEVVRGPWGR